VDLSKLPAYLPSLPPPQVEEYMVHAKLLKVKSTKSTLPIDLRNKLRKEVSVELVKPLTNIINACLTQGRWPVLWKREWVCPVPKVPEPKVLKDVRKVACTSDYNKVLESFTKDWILEDIAGKLDIAQYGGKKGMGPEHMVVALMDRVLSLLDKNPSRSAVLKTGADWDSAFDRGDPTTTIIKFLRMDLRPSIVPLLQDFLTGRTCSVRYNSAESSLIRLVGGFPQGSLIGQDAYLVTSDDCADTVEPEDKFRYIDDLEILELIKLSGILIDYDTHSHVPADVGTHQQFLPPDTLRTPSYLDSICDWTDSNLMKLNPSKSSYMLFTRSQEQFATRLALNSQLLEQKQASKILGIWIEEDAGSWQTNTTEICKSAYGRMSMLSKLKYVGVNRKDLIQIYCLFIRSRAEYCSVVFHNSLTQAQEKKIENIQKTSLKIILQDQYEGYEAACQLTGLTSLVQRREARSLTFARRCLDSPEMSRFFPRLGQLPQQELRDRDTFVVNFARTSSYQQSAIVHCQKQLNQYMHEVKDKKKEEERGKEERWREWMAQLDERLRRRREGQEDREEGG
jgi:hypothetical protein